MARIANAAPAAAPQLQAGQRADLLTQQIEHAEAALAPKKERLAGLAAVASLRQLNNAAAAAIEAEQLAAEIAEDEANIATMRAALRTFAAAHAAQSATAEFAIRAATVALAQQIAERDRIAASAKARAGAVEKARVDLAEAEAELGRYAEAEKVLASERAARLQAEAEGNEAPAPILDAAELEIAAFRAEKHARRCRAALDQMEAQNTGDTVAVANQAVVSAVNNLLIARTRAMAESFAHHRRAALKAENALRGLGDIVRLPNEVARLLDSMSCSALDQSVGPRGRSGVKDAALFWASHAIALKTTATVEPDFEAAVSRGDVFVPPNDR